MGKQVKKARDPFFDNAKFILIFFVVLGHLIEPYALDIPFYKTVFVFIYFFHMPAFVLVSGYFSKNFKNWKYALNLVVVYIIFQTLYKLFLMMWGAGDQVSFLYPYYIRI